MGLQPAATRQVHSTRRDIVDRCAAIFLKRRDLLAWFWDLIAWLREANVHVRNGRFRRCIGWLVLDLLIRRQSRATRKNPHGQPEPLVEGRAITNRGEPIVERRGTILQSVETLLERRVTASGRVGRHGSAVG